MVGFLNAHGKNPNLFSGEFLDLNFGIADDVSTDDRREMVVWVSIDELIDTPDEPVAPQHFDPEEEMTYWSSPFLGDDYHYDDGDDRPGIAILKDGTCIILDFTEIGMNNTVGLRPLNRFDFDDTYMPSFSSNHYKYRLNIWEDEEKFMRSYWRTGRNRGRKQAKFHIDGKLGRKDQRRHRVGNRQEFAELRDYWSDVFDIYEEIHQEWNQTDPRAYGVEVVGMTDEEASYYEHEARREREEYYRELELSLWSWEEAEPDYSHLFEPVNDLTKDTWERHLFPEQFEPEPTPYRFSSFGYYDDYDDCYYYNQLCDSNDSFEDDRHCDSPDYDEDIDFGPTLDEWEMIDQIAIERMIDEEENNFTPRFGSTVYKRKVREYDYDAKLPSKRSKAHTADRGWRHYAPKQHHGRDSIRHMPIWTLPRHTTTSHLSNNGRQNRTH